MDSFGLTTNNITYAVKGNAMRYWEFFPAEDGWGRIPVWGFATVAASASDGISEGQRFYGYLPPADHLVVDPSRVDRQGFVDAAPRRASLPSAYQGYRLTETDPIYEERHEGRQILLWPLYYTSWLIDDFLADSEFFGARKVILSSASSRTASALAYPLSARGKVEVIGLTSPRNAEFVEGLGCYERVATYDQIDSLEPEPSVYVDMAGDAKVRSAVHGRLGDRLEHSAAVGVTHREELGGGAELAGPKPEFFFAPTWITKRVSDWGRDALNARVAADWRPYVEWTEGWLTVDRGRGPEDIERVYREVLDGRSDPSIGHVLSPGG
ncbi:MAG TPA: DUF2855 family protein [Solirubrobacterales bacterium]|nr:DUF2855 family protein [Solirubrobacterales bacterium]